MKDSVFLFKCTFIFLISLMVVVVIPMKAQTVSYTTKERSLPCLDKEFSIFVHVIQDSLGSGGLPISKIESQIDGLNELFAPICARFSVCDVAFYPTYQFQYIWKPDQVLEMEKRYFVRHVINLFVIDRQAIRPGDYGGFAHHLGISQPEMGSVFVLRDFFETKNIAHQLGHYFGLLHTWTGNGEELVDGSNCATAGDLICDTPADPFDPDIDGPPFLGDGHEECLFIYPGVDANGEFYRPDTGNIMSSYQRCYCGFTLQQLELMARNYLQSVHKKW